MPNGNGKRRNNKPRKRRPYGGARGRNLSNQIVDLTMFNARRKFRFTTTATFAGEVAANVQLAPLSVNTSEVIQSIRTFLGSFTALKIDSATVCFDRRLGSANYRVGAFLLPGAVSNYTGDNAGKIAQYVGNGLSQLQATRRIPLKIGPEFAVGRFFNPAIPIAPQETIVLLQEGYNENDTNDPNESSVRIIVCVTTLGPPIKFDAAQAIESADELSTSREEPEEIPDGILEEE